MTGWSPIQHQWGDQNSAKYPPAGNFQYNNQAGSHSIGTGQGGYRSGQHRHKLAGITSEGGGQAHENRPRWVGLIWIVKVRDPSPALVS
jgi:hypothetical protein